MIRQEKVHGELDLNFVDTSELSKEELIYRNTERVLYRDKKYIDSLDDIPIDIMKYKGSDFSLYMLSVFLRDSFRFDDRRVSFLSDEGQLVPIAIGDYVVKYRSGFKVVDMAEMNKILEVLNV